jgi:hypothetical protein
MENSHVSAFVWAMATLITLGSSACFSQDASIGNATATKNKVEGLLGMATGSIQKGASLYTDELIRTGDASVADLKFINDSMTSVGPLSEAKLDKFVYDPSGSGAVVIEATKGSFRFVTGRQDQKAYQIKTPYGTLEIRG